MMINEVETAFLRAGKRCKFEHVSFGGLEIAVAAAVAIAVAAAVAWRQGLFPPLYVFDEVTYCVVVK